MRGVQKPSAASALLQPAAAEAALGQAELRAGVDRVDAQDLLEHPLRPLVAVQVLAPAVHLF